MSNFAVIDGDIRLTTSGGGQLLHTDDQDRLKVVMSVVAEAHTLSGVDHIGQLADSQVTDSNVTQYESVINHNNLFNYVLNEHRLLNDSLETNINLWSAQKITSEISTATGTLTSDHGNLTGLVDDDHTQYHNDTRGDIRYYTKTQLNTGQLDNRYYTETEVDTISGSLQININNKPDTLLELTDTPSTYDNSKYLQSTAAGTFWAAIAGIAGPKGDDGGEWIGGYGAPTASTGTLNNFYIDYNNGDIYRKETTITGSNQYGVMLAREASGSYTFADAVRFVKTGHEIIVDNLDDDFSIIGIWNTYNTTNAYNGSCRYAMTDYTAQANFKFVVPENGEYDVYAYWPALAGACPDAPYMITHVSGTTTIRKDQRINGSTWNYLSTHEFDGAATWVWKMNIQGSTTFSGLSDTPSSYDNGKYLKSTTIGTEWYNLNDDYYTETEVDTISGSLQSNINTHISSTSNPHTVTIEQARTANNIMTGGIIFNPPSNMTVIDISAANRDLIWMLGHNTDGYGWYWEYTGTGTGDANYLYLYSENGAGTDYWIFRHHQTTHLTEVDDTFRFLTTRAIQFRDTDIYINSADDGHLDLDADISIDLNADTDLSNNNLNNVQRVSFEQRTTDPTSPTTNDGDVWYRNDIKNFEATTNNLTHEVQLVKIIECYNTTALNVNVLTPIAVSWGGEDFKDDLYTHSTTINNTRVEVERDGIYEISYAICVDNTASSRCTIRSRVRVNGTTYQSRGSCYSYSRNTTDDKQTNTTTVPISLSANDYIEIMCDRQGSSGTANTIINESFIYIKLIRYT